MCVSVELFTKCHRSFPQQWRNICQCRCHQANHREKGQFDSRLFFSTAAARLGHDSKLRLLCEQSHLVDPAGQAIWWFRKVDDAISKWHLDRLLNGVFDCISCDFHNQVLWYAADEKFHIWPAHCFARIEHSESFTERIDTASANEKLCTYNSAAIHVLLLYNSEQLHGKALLFHEEFA